MSPHTRVHVSYTPIDHRHRVLYALLTISSSNLDTVIILWYVGLKHGHTDREKISNFTVIIQIPHMLALNMATHTRREISNFAPHIGCFVHTHSRGTTEMNKGTHTFFLARTRQQTLEHTHTHIPLKLVSLVHLVRLHTVCVLLIIL